MALNLSPGHVLCPACAGSGLKILTSQQPAPPCAVCQGTAEITEDLAERFWECVRTATFTKVEGVISHCIYRGPPWR